MESTPQFKKPIQFFWHYAKKRWYLLVPIVLGITLARTVSTVIPLQYKLFVDNLSSQSPSEDFLSTIIFTVLCLNMISWIGWRILDVTIAHFENKTMMDVANYCFDYLHKHSYEFFTNNFAGALVNKISKLVKSVEILSDTIFLNLYPCILLTITSLVLIATIQPFFSFILLIWFIAFLAFNIFILRYKIPLAIRANEINSEHVGHLADTIINHATITQFSALEREKKAYERIGNAWIKAFLRSWYLSSFSFAIQALMMIATEFTIMWYVIQLWKQGNLSVGDFVAIQTLMLMIFWRLWDFGRYMRSIYMAYADAKEMLDILATPHQIADELHAPKLERSKGSITLRDLDFSYIPSQGIFKKFSLAIPAKKKIALVSESGQGKTTLVKLLLRLYNVPEKTIFIDEQDITMVTQESLREAIAFVPQDPILFHRTLAENIAYGNPTASMDEIIAVSKKAHCHEFITSLPEKYETYVGERGIKLSGGERQRIAIARAMLKNAPILILDEATSSLDSSTEALIQEALRELMKNRTSIVIAHRLSTVMMMDEIIVILHGAIAERGTHQELLAQPNSHYKRLWEIQAGGFAE